MSLNLSLKAGIIFLFAVSLSPVLRAETQTVKSFDDAFTRLRDERDALRHALDDLKSTHAAVTDDLKKRLQIAEEEKQKEDEILQAAQEKIGSLEEENAGLKEKLEDRKSQIERLKDMLDTKDQAIADAKSENKALETNLDDAERALEKAAARIQKLEERKEALP